MLKDLGVLVKVGQHANVAGLIGVCEEPGISERVEMSHKDILV